MADPGRLYLQRHRIDTYLAEAVRMLLDDRRERPVEAVAEYFERVRDGSHVLHREYAHVRATPHNQLSFLRLVRDAISQMPPDSEVAPSQFHELLGIVCPDFPFEVLHVAARLCTRAKLLLPADAQRESGGGGDALPLALLLHALATQMYYGDFFRRAGEVFVACDTRSINRVNRSVLTLTLRQMMVSNAWPFPAPSPSVVDALMSEASPALAARRDGLIVGAPQIGAGSEQRAASSAAPSSPRRPAQQTAQIEISGDEFEVRLFCACVGTSSPLFDEAARLAASRAGGMDDDEMALHRRKAEIRARWASRRTARGGSTRTAPQGQAQAQQRVTALSPDRRSR